MDSSRNDPPGALEPDTGPFEGPAAPAIEDARLRQALEEERRRADLAERRLADVERLRQIGLDLAHSLDLAGIVEQVVEVARRHAASDLAVCAVVDPATFQVEALAASDVHAPASSGPGPPAGRALLGWILRHARPFRSEDCRIDPQLAHEAEPAEPADGVIACLGVPMVQETRVIGAIWVGNRTRRPFTDHNEAFLGEVADHAVAAIVNARAHAERQRTLDELRASQERLVTTERLRALGEMAAGVAHDFNNLLAVILGRTQLLTLTIDDPHVRRGLAVIESAATEAAQTVRRIQEFTRTRQSRTYAPLDVGQILCDAIELTRGRWKDEAQIGGVTYTITPDIIETPAVAGDASELRELFANLLLNAFDAMPEGGAVSVSVRAIAEGVLAQVADTGPGMTPEVRQRIFEPFFTTKGPRRTGLGLSVAYGIVQRHHGSIDVQSAAGRGTTFTVLLPISPRPSETRPEPSLHGPSAGRPARVLVVEDEALVRDVLVDLLRAAGHVPLAAADGPRGLALLDPAVPPDVALIDLGLPGMSGLEVASRIRAANPAVPLVLVTGWGDHIDHGDIERSGISQIIAKPFQTDEILRLVADAARRRATP